MEYCLETLNLKLDQDLKSQKKLGFSYAKACPEGHYARKNIGYLLALSGGAELIIETDDDNFPKPSFWKDRINNNNVRFVDKLGWSNVYSYFSNENIWPRGFPLSNIKDPSAKLNSYAMHNSPIQQSLADENPDVDAIYRLIAKLPINFHERSPIALYKGVWCPFNSQNTTWFKEAFKLMYLPAYCSFRMTDIWRSFVAQRIAWEMKWSILFCKSTMWQERNEHNLMQDFLDEVPGYVNNDTIVKKLEELNLKNGASSIDNNLRICYKVFYEMGLIDSKEFSLLDAWIEDISKIFGKKS